MAQGADFVFALPERAEAANINIGGTLYPTSIIVERNKGDNELEQERIDNLQRVVVKLLQTIKDMQEDSKTANDKLQGELHALKEELNHKDFQRDTLDPTSNIDERGKGDTEPPKELEDERIDNLQRVVLSLVENSKTANDELQNLKEKLALSEFGQEGECEIKEIESDTDETIDLKDVLRLVEQSAKAIQHMNEHQFSTVWSQCSKNTYGFFIRNVLLCGSTFHHQLIPDSFDLMAISILGVIFAAGMQFMLAWYLWVNLPSIYPLVTGNGNVLKPYPGASQSDEKGGYLSGRGYFEAKSGFCVAPDCLTAPLPSYQFPDYSAANDVCRTQSIVQIICIGLFLFSVLTNVPGIIKNALIILSSERFLSEDDEGITKIHYWRESDFSRETQVDFLDQQQEPDPTPNSNSNGEGQPRTGALPPASDEQPQTLVAKPNFNSAGPPSALNSAGPPSAPVSDDKSQQARRRCDFFRTVEFKDPSESKNVNSVYLRSTMLANFYLPLGDFGKPGIVKFVESVRSCFKAKAEAGSPEEEVKNNPLKGLPRSFFEIADARQFLSEILQDMSDKDRVLKTIDDKGGIKDPSIPYAESVKYNLVRADYLKPNFLTRPFAYHYLAEVKLERLKDGKNGKAAEPQNLARRLISTLFTSKGYVASEQEVLDQKFIQELDKLNIKELKDHDRVRTLYTKYPARMRRFRFLAFLFGVIPEVVSLIVVTFAGVQFILWSGFKISSDSRGMEEIILATLAICFVYDIDDTLYAHVLPEFYKTAHERDRFELRGWVSSSLPTGVAEAQSFSFFWKILSFHTRSFFYAVFPTRVRPPRLDIVSAIQTEDAKRETENALLAYNDTRGNPGGHPDSATELMISVLRGASRLRRGIPALSEAKKERNEVIEKDGIQEAKEMYTRKIREIAQEMVEDFENNMLIQVARAKSMSVKGIYSDFYLARQYPFFYARKFHMYFTGHLWEGFLVWYGRLGLHFLVLLALALSIVGAYRTAARCDRYSSSPSIWSTQEWPSTCVMNVSSKPAAAQFKDLRGRPADQLMPVSCGLTGYLPTDAEWQANKDFFIGKR